MPLFEYRCKKCKRRFSFLVGVTREKARLECPRCGCTKVTKLISRIAPISRSEDFDDLDDADFEGADEDLEDYGDDYGDEDFDD